jgi:fatty acid/phospholipid biosynthesis enzyme
MARGVVPNPELYSFPVSIYEHSTCTIGLLGVGARQERGEESSGALTQVDILVSEGLTGEILLESFAWRV